MHREDNEYSMQPKTAESNSIMRFDNRVLLIIENDVSLKRFKRRQIFSRCRFRVRHDFAREPGIGIDAPEVLQFNVIREIPSDSRQLGDKPSGSSPSRKRSPGGGQKLGE